MRPHRALGVLVLAAVLGPAPLVSKTELESCFADAPGDALASCLRSRLASRGPSADELARLGPVVAGDPRAAAALAQALLDRDGSNRLVWFRATGGETSVGVDLADGRLEQAAEVLAGAGRRDEARRLLERALSLGAQGRAETAWRQSGGGIVPGRDPVGSPLLAEPWFPRAPELEVSRVDGGTIRLSPAGGAAVIVLDFWATWCRPCLRSLPELDALSAELAPQGLIALAINTEEGDDQIREFAARLGLTLPIGRYDRRLDQAFRVRTLPTTILIDRAGRIRRRWEGNRDGIEGEIARTVRDLLAGKDPEGAPRTVAEVLAGAGLFRSRWIRDGGPVIDGLALAPAARGQTGTILTVRKRRLVSFDPAGDVVHRADVPDVLGRLAPADLDGDGDVEVVGYRPGGTEVAMLEPDAVDRLRTWRVPAHVVELVPTPVPGPGGPAQILAATDRGLYRLRSEDSAFERLEGIAGATASVAVVGSGATRQILGLGTDGKLRRLDPSGRLLEELPAPEGVARIFAAGDAGWGMGPGSVRALAAGRFLGGSAAQAAVVTRGSQLVVVDLDDGRVLLRAHWPGVHELAAGDLDGDGADELVVAAGPALTLLSAAGHRG